MKYINSYILFKEGFTKEQLDSLISNKETYVEKINRLKDENKIRLFADDIIRYDISNFKYRCEYDHYIIEPDDDFNDLYKKYCNANNFNYEPLVFDIEFTKNHPIAGYNTLDVYNLINSNIKGLSIGYKIYLYILDKVSFITSNYSVSDEAMNLWYNLLKSESVYSGVSNKNSIIIKRQIDDDELREILNLVDKYNYKYDDELKERINGFKIK